MSSIQEVIIDLGRADLIPIPGASRNLVQVGGVTVEKTEITRTTGWSNTQTEEASMSVTAEIGGSYGAASFSVSATAGFGFSNSTTLSTSTSIKQTYNFRPGYVTKYYQWGVGVRDKQVLNGVVKLEAKSVGELLELKGKKETEASTVKLTVKKVVPPAEGFFIQNVASGYALFCHNYGKGNVKMEASRDYAHVLLKAEKVEDPREDSVYRFISQRSGHFLHCHEGRGNVQMHSKKHPYMQLFKLIPTGKEDYFQLQSYNSTAYKVNSDNGGRGNVWMSSGTADRAGQIFKFVEKRKSSL